MNIFVGNLLFEATEEDVRKLFEGFGSVASVAIVMDKKGRESRGFGFVEIPNDQEAQAAIAALDGREFMSRVLNVSPARPKSNEEWEVEKKEKMQARLEAKAQAYAAKGKVREGQSWFDPVFRKTGGYRGGRRTRRFIEKSVAAGIEPVMPKRKHPANPMRWRKKQEQPKPWQKKSRRGESKPWKEAPGESKPWNKAPGESKPWKKVAGESKPWKKAPSESKPWKKTVGKPKPWRKI